MINLFLDESGDFSFSSKSVSKHFLITIVSIDSSDLNKLKNRLRRHNANIIKSDWDKTEEIKASKLYYKNKKVGKALISKILYNLKQIDSLGVSYIIVNKEKITSRSFRDAPYGIAYNYFSGLLLLEFIIEEGFHDVHLVDDKKNKETHENKHFREYLQAQVLGNALQNDIIIDLRINAGESRKYHGLAAVDYFCWSFYRKFEYGDNSFFKLFADILKRRREWYIKK